MISPIAKGFTLVELMVSVAIFAFMTSLLVTKYGNFNQTILLSNLAYDTALILRTAQTFGLSVKQGQSPLTTDAFVPSFNVAYGVVFNKMGSMVCGGSYNSTRFAMYSDSDYNGIYNNDCHESVVTSYALKKGALVSALCVGTSGTSCNTDASRLDVTYKRPAPEAIICPDSTLNNTATKDCEKYVYAEITLNLPGQGSRKVVIYKNGQIEVKD